MKKNVSFILCLLAVLTLVFTFQTEEAYAYSGANIPYLGMRVCSLDSSDPAVRWVQTQLKDTGIWYQGSEWLVTGHLGKHTMQEIKAFMQSMGYPNHTGVVDQQVIDALCDYFGYGGTDQTGSQVNNPDVPYLGMRVCSLDSSDPAVRWVQTQLKDTGIWYQGNEWLVTGHLGKHTMQEIKAFMQSMGYPNHTGVVDQKVIDALCEYFGYVSSSGD